MGRKVPYLTLVTANGHYARPAQAHLTETIGFLLSHRVGIVGRQIVNAGLTAMLDVSEKHGLEDGPWSADALRLRLEAMVITAMRETDLRCWGDEK